MTEQKDGKKWSLMISSIYQIIQPQERPQDSLPCNNKCSPYLSQQSQGLCCLLPKKISTNTQPLQRNISIIEVTIKAMRVYKNQWSVQGGRKQWGKATGVVSEGKERAKGQKEHHQGSTLCHAS